MAMKFKKGDLLGTSVFPIVKSISTPDPNGPPVARVAKVTRDGSVHCVNLVKCSTMDAGQEFRFVPDEWTRYYPLPKK